MKINTVMKKLDGGTSSTESEITNGEMEFESTETPGSAISEVDSVIANESTEGAVSLEDLVDQVDDNTKKLEAQHLWFEQTTEDDTAEITIPSNIASQLKANHTYYLDIQDDDETLFDGLIAYKDGHYLGFSGYSDYDYIRIETNGSLIILQAGNARTHFMVDIIRTV